MLEGNENIPQRAHHPMATSKVMRSLVPQQGEYPNAIPLPAALVAHADQTAMSVIEYRREVLGLSEQGQEHGGLDRGVQRENVNERGIGAGAADRADIPRTDSPVPSPNDDAAIATHGAADDDDDEADDDDALVHIIPHRIGRQPLLAESSDTESEPNNDHMEMEIPKPDVIITNVLTEIATSGGIRMDQGVQVEIDIIVSKSERGRKEIVECVTRSEKEIPDLSQTTSIRAATSTVVMYPLRSSIKTDIVRPAVQLHSPLANQ